MLSLKSLRESRGFALPIVLGAVLLFSTEALGKPSQRAPSTGAGAPATVQESTRALNVNGQVRNLSMLPVLKRERGQLNFGNPRTDYRDKIPKTIF
jgi:hypothetical protein